MPGTLVVDTGANVWRAIRFDLRVRHGLRRWRQPAALRADDLRRPQPLPAASSARWRAKRLTLNPAVDFRRGDKLHPVCNCSWPVKPAAGARAGSIAGRADIFAVPRSRCDTSVALRPTAPLLRATRQRSG